MQSIGTSIKYTSLRIIIVKNRIFAGKFLPHEDLNFLLE